MCTERVNIPTISNIKAKKKILKKYSKNAKLSLLKFCCLMCNALMCNNIPGRKFYNRTY